MSSNPIFPASRAELKALHPVSFLGFNRKSASIRIESVSSMQIQRRSINDLEQDLILMLNRYLEYDGNLLSCSMINISHNCLLSIYFIYPDCRLSISLFLLCRISKVIEITCGDSKAAYDEVKSRRGHPVVADIAGADVSGQIKYFTGGDKDAPHLIDAASASKSG